MNPNVDIKSDKYAQINHSFQKLSEILMRQFALVESLLEVGWKDEHYKQFLENEENIDEMEIKMMEIIPALVIQFSPKASDLRKIVSCHEVILFLEQIGDFLINIVDCMRSADLRSSDYNEFNSHLKKMFWLTQMLVHGAAYSFYKEDIQLAYQIIQSDYHNQIKSLSEKVNGMIISSFQDIPLIPQELINILAINNLLCIMVKVRKIASEIAKSTIFVIEGKDLRHRNIEK